MIKYRKLLSFVLVFVMISNYLSSSFSFAVNLTNYESGLNPDSPGDDWIGINASNISSYTTSSGGCYYFDGDGAKYYLDGDLAMDVTLYVYPGRTVTIDLNGHDWKINDGKTDLTVANIKSNATLNLYDSGTETRYVHLGDDHRADFVASTDSYDFTITGGSLSGGSDAKVGGGGVFVQENATFNMYGGNIMGNVVDHAGRYGGGIYVSNNGAFNLYNGAVIGNTSLQSKGGGVYNVGGTVHLYGGEIAYNTAGVGYGGGLYNAGTFHMEGGDIHHNTASTSGGGGISSVGDMTFSGGTIRDNNAYSSGGGIFLGAHGVLTMTGGSITGNHAGSGGAGGVFVNTSTSKLEMSGGSITHNTTTGASAGVAYSDGVFALSGNAVITGNIVVDANGDKIKDSNIYLLNGQTIDLGNAFTGTAGVIVAAGGGQATVGTAGSILSDNTHYYPVKVNGNIQLLEAVTKVGTNTAKTYGDDYAIATMFDPLAGTVYTLLGGTGKGSINGSTLTVDSIGTFEIQAFTDYSPTNPPTTQTATLTVNAKTVTITGITAVNTVGTDGKTVPLNNTSGTLAGVVTGDDVAIDFSGAYGTITSTGTGTQPVTLHGIALKGDDASNYVIDTINSGNGTSITITETTPYIAWPTAIDLTYGTPRQDSDLLGGKVMIRTDSGSTTYTDITDSGHFEWVTTENKNAGTHTYGVRFVQTDTATYGNYTSYLSSVTHNITQLVHTFGVAFEITNSVVEKDSRTSLSITAMGEDGNALAVGNDYQLYFATKNEDGSWNWLGNGTWDSTQAIPTAVGEYLIAADFTHNSTTATNYNHAGTMEGTAKQIGTYVVHEGTPPTTYTVTFEDENGDAIIDIGDITGAPLQTIHILPTIPGDTYMGWTRTWGGKTYFYEFGTRFPQNITENTAFIAVPSPTPGTVSGVIKGTNLDGTTNQALNGVVVTLMQGDTQVAHCVTAHDGTYSFTVPQGRYNLVVTRDFLNRNEETVLVNLNTASLAMDDITLPDVRQNTIFNVGSGMTDITIFGMKGLFDVTDATSLKVDMTTAVIADTRDILAKAAESALTTDNVKLFYDISIQKRSADASNYTELDDLGDNYLTFYIPLTGIYQGYSKYEVFCDNGDGTITILDNASATPTIMAASTPAPAAFMSVENGLLTLHINKSGVYGLAFYNDMGTQVTSTANYTYTSVAVDIDNDFTTIFPTIPNTAGARTYVITGGTGAGTITANGKLSVTKVGTFDIAVKVAKTASEGAYIGKVTVTVAPKPVIISGITCVDREVNNGDTAVTINTGGLISTIETGDDLQIDYSGTVTATIKDANFASDPALNDATIGKQTFAVTVTGLTLGGADRDNYVLTSIADSTVNVTKSFALISWPTATNITYTQAQSNDDLYGGKVLVVEDGVYTDITSTGQFQWTAITTPTSVGTASYAVKFVETNATYDGDSSYKNGLNLGYTISQTVDPLAVTFTIAHAQLEYGEALAVTAQDEFGKAVASSSYTLYYAKPTASGGWDWGDLTYTTQPTEPGTYLIGASLTANHHHNGTQENTAKQIGAFTIGNTAQTYKVTFVGHDDGTQYDITNALPQSIHILPTLSDSYMGWQHENGTIYTFGGRFPQLAEDVVFTAIPAPVKDATISGTITGTDVNGSPNELLRGIGVALYQGNTLIATTETAGDGTYHFSVPAGTYNLVVNRDYDHTDAHEMTSFVDVSTVKTKVVDLDLTDSVKNAMLTVAKGLPDIVVAGLDTLAELGTKDGTLESSIHLQVAAGNNQLSDPAVTAILTEAEKSDLTKEQVKQYMDITVKGTSYDDSTNTYDHNVPLKETDALLTFYIPLTGIYQGHKDYIVYRYHTDSLGASRVDTLTATPNAQGEYATVSGNNLKIAVKYFSVYAVAFANPAPSTGTATPTYSNIVAPGEHGSIGNLSHTKPTAGTRVTFTPSADDGFVVDTVTVTDRWGNTYPLTHNGDGSYTFTQPSTTVTISATFSDNSTSKLPFTDVSEDDWFYEDVLYLYEKELISGVTPTTFAPNSGSTRGAVAQMMYNLEGQPERTEFGFFTDVVDGQWYEPAVNWCASHGVVDGYPDGFYRPNQTISREEFAAILYDHCLHLEDDVSALHNLADFHDAPSPWAVTYMQWAVEAEIYKGDDQGYLHCTDQLTRAQAAAVMARFLQNVYQ